MMPLRDGDLAAVESSRPEDLSLVVEFPLCGVMRVTATAVMGGGSRLTVVADGYTIAESAVADLPADLPGWHEVQAHALLRGEPGTTATLGATLLGTWTGQSRMVASEFASR